MLKLKMKNKDSFVKVDAYLIPTGEHEGYVRDRDELREKAKEVFSLDCAHVECDFSGSEDGEAVVGVNEDGEIVHLIYLDPMNVEEYLFAKDTHKLKEFFKRF